MVVENGAQVEHEAFLVDAGDDGWRRAAPPIITRIHEERLVFDLRTILNDHEEQSIVESLAKIMEKNEA